MIASITMWMKGVIAMVKSFFVSLIALLCGVLITIFGVFLSIFSDGNMNERLILITIVLLILFALSSLFTTIQPQRSVLNVALMGSGGITVLILNYQNIYYLFYIFSILLVCVLGVITGRNLHMRFEKKSLK